MIQRVTRNLRAFPAWALLTPLIVYPPNSVRLPNALWKSAFSIILNHWKSDFPESAQFRCRAIEKGHFLKSDYFHGFAFSDHRANIPDTFPFPFQFPDSISDYHFHF